MRTLLDTKHDKPYVIFCISFNYLIVHCECGCDRTGEVGANFVIKYHGWNFTRAMTFNEAVPKRHILYVNQVNKSEYY